MQTLLDGLSALGGWRINFMQVATIAVILLVFVIQGFRINQEYQRAVVYRLGRFVNVRGPGLFWIIPFIEWSTKVDVRILSVNLQTQETLSRDGVAVKVNAVVWYCINDPAKAVNSVLDPHTAVLQAAETSLRDVIGQHDLDAILKGREQINALLMTQLDRAANKWGVDIDAVEMRDLDIPVQMQRALAQEAEATREAKARLIKAQGEQAASETLRAAAMAIAEAPGAMELRRLQTLQEIGTEQNSTIILGFPQELLHAAKKLSGE
ncbi:SPFH domain-containing protein [Asticcacaulis excentricus]|jgi:regulator of protease activity HflC (stomatin/prohibitin superfamily)|uniref:Putative stomatin/prohibitin-family membrane protease subunit aq_911 n=1 Tax=Asticcacaulis excentricus TaxID=78587 RepID=A0A3G9GCG0_9CAUL|nr:SPFH domain-containing protein [Asticcacaulis excentricus]BBF82328.1 putative stomatin/prohibitin-family membrane protease subunit aq_911 [Asticcacaulis excentricus]